MGVAGCRHSLGDLALEQGVYGTAAELYREALEEMVASGSDYDVAYCLAGLAAVAAHAGRDEEAGRLWGAVERVEEELALRLVETDRKVYGAALADVPPAEVEAGRVLTTAEAVELARRLG